MSPTEESAATPRRRRADAVRNSEAVLEAAKAAFAESGVDAPMRDIAARAGVGVGTIYRNYPLRSDLIIAVFRRELDATSRPSTRRPKLCADGQKPSPASSPPSAASPVRCTPATLPINHCRPSSSACSRPRCSACWTPEPKTAPSAATSARRTSSMPSAASPTPIPATPAAKRHE